MRILAALLFTVLFSGSVLAGQCPGLAMQVEQQMKSIEMDEMTRMKVQGLLDKGRALHSNENHGESVKVLKQAIQTMDAASEG